MASTGINPKARERVVIKAIKEWQADLVRVLLELVPVNNTITSEALHNADVNVLRAVLKKNDKFLLALDGEYMEFLIRNMRVNMIHFLVENYDIKLDSDARHKAIDIGYHSIYKYLCKHNLDPKSFNMEHLFLHTVDPNTLNDLLQYHVISDLSLRSAVHESLYSESIRHIKVLLDYRREDVMQMIPEEFRYNTSVAMIHFLNYLGIDLCKEFTSNFRKIVRKCDVHVIRHIIQYLEKHSIAFPVYAFDVLDRAPNPCQHVEKRRFLETYVPTSFTKGTK